MKYWPVKSLRFSFYEYQSFVAAILVLLLLGCYIYHYRFISFVFVIIDNANKFYLCILEGEKRVMYHAWQCNQHRRHTIQ